jgi:hypothetical protein
MQDAILKEDLINFILNHAKDRSADNLMNLDITSLVMIKSQLEIDSFKNSKAKE